MALAQTLDSLRRRDDTLDISARQSELLSLVDGLLPSEIRVLQQSLAKFTFICDFIPELPVEILIMITSFLDVIDLVNVRHVSQRWKESWTQIPVCNKLMKENFRYIFENDYNLLPEKSDTRPSMFIAATQKLFSMRMGNYHLLKSSRYYHDWQGRDYRSRLDCKYESGRVAWVIKDSVIVTDLYSGVVKTYRTPERADVRNWLLSSKVLVVQGHKTLLHAWDLDTGQIFSVKLPNVPKTNGLLTACGTQVGVITARNEIMIWMVGGALYQLGEESTIFAPNEHCDGVSLIFHRFSMDTVFLISCAQSEHDDTNCKAKWKAQKYLRNQRLYKLMNTFELDLPLKTPLSLPEDIFPSSDVPPTVDQYRPYCQPDEMLWLSPQKLDENGNYIIGSLPNPVDSAWRKLSCEHESEKCNAVQCNRIRQDYPMYLILNIYQEKLRPRCLLIYGRRGLDYTYMVSEPFLGVHVERDNDPSGMFNSVESGGIVVMFHLNNYTVMGLDEHTKVFGYD